MRTRDVLSMLLPLLLCAPSARADDEADAQASALFKEGRALMKEGRFDDACPKLEQSQRLSPSGGTLLNVAVCHEHIGRIATAWGEFQAALTAARTDGKEDRARLAAERIQIIEPRLPWLTIEVPEAAQRGLRVELDGAPIGPIAFGKEMPVDPGEHRLVVIAPSSPPRELAVKMGEGERRTVVLEDLASSPDPSASPVPPPPPPPPPAAPPKLLAPPPPPPPPPSTPDVRRSRGRIVFEVGAFAGLLSGDVGSPEPDNEGWIPVTDEMGRSTSCAEVSCSYDLGAVDSALLGGSGFVGYAVTERFHLGLRALGGARVGGGFAFAAGPGASVRVLGPLWAGGYFVLGDVRVPGRGAVSVQSGYVNPEYDLVATTGLTVGSIFELGLGIVEMESGALFVELSPMFLIASAGPSITLPVSLAYRFF